MEQLKKGVGRGEGRKSESMQMERRKWRGANGEEQMERSKWK